MTQIKQMTTDFEISENPLHLCYLCAKNQKYGNNRFTETDEKNSNWNIDVHTLANGKRSG